jgi:hypothetical protein
MVSIRVFRSRSPIPEVEWGQLTGGVQFLEKIGKYRAVESKSGSQADRLKECVSDATEINWSLVSVETVTNDAANYSRPEQATHKDTAGLAKRLRMYYDKREKL